MRRAFSMNSGELDSMMMEEYMLPMVEEVTRRYEDRMAAVGDNKDDAFMLAALYQLQGDPEMAAMAADYVKRMGSMDTADIKLASLVEEEMHSIPMTTSAAWDLLAADRPNEALNAFFNEINADTQAGVPKLGYGLAALGTGDITNAAWAIRRAFEVDREAVSSVMLDGKLRPVLDRLVQQYEQAGEMNADVSLVLGTIYQLQGDLEGAEFIMEHGMLDSDDYLMAMMKEEMKAQEEMLETAMPELVLVSQETETNQDLLDSLTVQRPETQILDGPLSAADLPPVIATEDFHVSPGIVREPRIFEAPVILDDENLPSLDQEPEYELPKVIEPIVPETFQCPLNKKT